MLGSPNWSIYSWLWVIRSSDGGFDGDMLKLTHGNVGTSEHIAFDQAITWPEGTGVYLTFRQVSPTLRTRGNLVEYAGAYNFAKFDAASMTLQWRKEQEYWGESTAVLYKKWGAGDIDFFVGGACDYFRTDDSGTAAKWRVCFLKFHSNGAVVTTESTWLGTGNGIGDYSIITPVVEHMYIEDVYDGQDWIFGVTSNIVEATSAQRIYFWRSTIDPATRKFENYRGDNALISGLTDPGRIIAVKPTWDSSGHMHYVFVDGDNSIYYGTYDWGNFNTVTAIQIYSNIVSPRAVFYGSASAIESGTTVFQGFIGGALTTVQDSSGQN